MTRSKSALSFLLLLAAARGVDAQSVQFPSSAERWGVFEIVFTGGPSGGNPFADVSLSASFSQGGVTKVVGGFYDGGGTYRIRYMPSTTGPWTFTTSSNVAGMNGRTGSFTCTAASAGNRGPVRVRDQFHFQYEDGTPYHQIGTTAYGWTNQPTARQEQTLATMAQQKFNKLRFLVMPKYYVHSEETPPLWPFEGGPNAWNFNRPNYAFFQNYDNRVRQLRDMGIEADIILLNPYDGWALRDIHQNQSQEDRYLRYMVARLSAYRNVWWSMTNEYELWSTDHSYWDRIFQLVRDADAHNHLRSIHNMWQLYDHSKPWVTHASVQKQDTVPMENGRAYRAQWGKPIVWDEVGYEGTIPEPWGQLSPQEMVRRFWLGVRDGAYVGHSETYAHPQEIIWWAKGGTLVGQSHLRTNFLSDLVRDLVPGQSLEPLAGDARAAHHGTQCYLYYFDGDTSSSRAFSLPAGIGYRAYVIDTWNMTRSDVGLRSGSFTLSFPSRPYMAAIFLQDGEPEPPPPPQPGFVLGVNFNGGAGTIEGNPWISHAQALSSGLSFTGSPNLHTSAISPNPAVDPATAAMLNTAVWRQGADLSFAQSLADGSYDVFFWVMENYQSNVRSFDIRLEGGVVASNLGTMPLGEWRKYGPYRVAVSGGALNVDFLSRTGDAHVKGMAIFTADQAPPPPPPPPSGGFVAGVNFNGGAVTIEGNAWQSHAGVSFSTTPNLHTSSITPSPGVDAATASMLNTAAWRQVSDLSFSKALAAGDYDVYFWILENYQSNVRAFDIRLEGAVVATNVGTLPYGEWRKLGPYRVSVDGDLDVDFLHRVGDPHVMGMAIFSAGSTTPPPTLSVVASDANASESGDLGRFTVSRSGSTSSALTVSLSVGGSASNGGDFAAIGTSLTIPAGAASADIGVSPIDDASVEGTETVLLSVGGTSAVVSIADNDSSTPPPPPPPPTGTLLKGINFNGAAATIEGQAWLSHAQALANGLSYTLSPNVWTSQVSPTPGVDGDTYAMLNTAVWHPGSFGLRQTLPSGAYQIYLWVLENHQSNYRSFDLRLEGALAATSLGTLPYGEWRKYGPYAVTVSDGELALDLVRNFGDPHLMGLAIVAGTAPPPPNPDASLLLHWRLDETSGLQASDASGRGHVGQLNGAVWTEGRIGGGLDVQGDYVSAASTSSLNSAKTGLTAAFWVYKRADAPTWGLLAGRRMGPSWQDLWNVYYNLSGADEYSFGLSTSSGSAVLNGPSSAGDLNRWTHLAAVYDGGAMILYRDGEEVARRGHSGTIPDESSPLLLGAGDNGDLGIGEFVDVIFDDVRLYSRGLSAAEVGALAGGAPAAKAVAETATPTSSGGNDRCGLLGLELLLPLLLLGRRRYWTGLGSLAKTRDQ